VILDVPESLNKTLDVIITSTSGTAKCGETIVGVKKFLGDTRNGIVLSITDYSIKTTDDFGNYYILERPYSVKMECDLTVYNYNVDDIYNFLTTYRSVPLVWVAYEAYASLITYGFYKDFSIVIPYVVWSDCSLEIEGLI
jgi:hypothetical protein